jgi:hypothetical protein
MSEILEVESLINIATFPAVKSILQSYLNDLIIKKEKLENEKQENESKKTLNEEVAKTTIVKEEIKVIEAVQIKKIATKPFSYIPIESFAWDQGSYNSQSVTVFVDLDDVGTVKDSVEVNFTKTSFDVKVNNLNGKNYRLFKDNLEKDIVPNQSVFNVKKNKIVLKLQKVKGEYSYDQWSSLTAKKSRKEEEKKADPMGGYNSKLLYINVSNII